MQVGFPLLPPTPELPCTPRGLRAPRGHICGHSRLVEGSVAQAIRQAFHSGCSQGGDAGGGAPGHRPHPRSCVSGSSLRGQPSRGVRGMACGALTPTGLTRHWPGSARQDPRVPHPHLYSLDASVSACKAQQPLGPPRRRSPSAMCACEALCPFACSWLREVPRDGWVPTGWDLGQA